MEAVSTTCGMVTMNIQQPARCSQVLTKLPSPRLLSVLTTCAPDFTCLRLLAAHLGATPWPPFRSSVFRLTSSFLLCLYSHRSLTSRTLNLSVSLTGLVSPSPCPQLPSNLPALEVTPVPTVSLKLCLQDYHWSCPLHRLPPHPPHLPASLKVFVSGPP